jgi:hypothetical protein
MAQTASQSLASALSGLAFRNNLNTILAAMFSGNSGPSAPSPTVGGMLWLDTGVSPPVLRMRNNANTDWVTIAIDQAGALDQTNNRIKLPGGLLKQWGIQTLTPVGNFNTLTIGGTTFYTNYYTITYPLAFSSAVYAGNVSIVSAPFGAQAPMAGVTASLNLEGNGSPLTRCTVAVATTTLGYVPNVYWEVTGR